MKALDSSPTARTRFPAAGRVCAEPSGPIRTCIGCRQRERDVELLRVVVVDGIVVPDPARRLPGRGAWLHPRSGCLTIAERRRAFARALRVPAGVETKRVRRYLESPRNGESGSVPASGGTVAEPRKQGDQS